MLNADRARQAIVDHTRQLAESAAEAGPDAAVPTTPEWTVTQLVEHVGQTQNWVAEMIEQRITDPTQLPTELAVLPADPGEWPAWLAESAQRLADACAEDVPVFNAAADGRTGVQFWLTTQLNEAVVHGFDAAAAAGRTVEVDADIAGALIGNHLAMLTSPTWELRRAESAHAIRGDGQVLQWQATDGGAWFVVRQSDGATWETGSREADVTISGRAGSLLLTLTRRLPLTDGDITVEGDAGLAQHWLDNTAHVSG
ncbi:MULTISPECIES: maleylpyruvate isomerase family mycothiol-dependent enzyme [Kribbella]|uniref:Maleylpyruvate isomerase family mycothiol-dependent enzyme n=1 Tax=Kribbella karoonensis TaxID=324851 RepID=A0ABP4PES6_9ACTN